MGQLVNARIEKDERLVEQKDSNGGWPALDDVIANRKSLNFLEAVRCFAMLDCHPGRPLAV
jgi:hypothetical protein